MRWFLSVGWILIWTWGCGTSAYSADEANQSRTCQTRGAQGDVLLISVTFDGAPQHVKGTFLDRSVWFFPIASGRYAGLLGIDLQDDPGTYHLLVHADYSDGPRRKSVCVTILKKDYPVQRLTLPKSMVELDQATLRRVRDEAQRVRQIFKHESPVRLWRGPFLEPVHGVISGRFGSRRIINGFPRSPHSGEDIAAPQGTPVVAMNSGVVRLTMNHFFTGNGVIIDHGLGLFSMYFHLSDIFVREGQRIAKGEPIGTVGATGRATGPHLHWGIRLNGARVDPYSLLAIAFEKT